MQAVSKDWWEKIQGNEDPDIEFDVGTMMDIAKPARFIYNKLNCNRAVQKRQEIQNRLAKELCLTEVDSIFLAKVCKNIMRISPITKYRDFQYRLILGKIYANNTLYKWGIISSDRCSMCGNRETVEHMLWQCMYAKNIWDKFESLWWEDQSVVVTYYTVFLSCVTRPDTHIANFLCMVGKQYLYRCKCQARKPNWDELKNEFIMLKRIDAYNLGSAHKFVKRWHEANLL